MHYGIHVEWKRMQRRRASSVFISSRFSLPRFLLFTARIGCNCDSLLRASWCKCANKYLLRPHKVSRDIKITSRKDVPGELLCNIWHLKFKFYKALQESISAVVELSWWREVKRAIRKHLALLCRSPLLRVVKFIRRGRQPDRRPLCTDIRFRCAHCG